MCVGFKFALKEARMVLISLYKSLAFSLDDKMHPPGTTLELDDDIILDPRHGIWVKAKSRT